VASYGLFATVGLEGVREGEGLLWRQSLESFKICPSGIQVNQGLLDKAQYASDIELFVFGPQWGLQGGESFGHHALLNPSSFLAVAVR